MNKTCSRCKETKDSLDFYPKSDRKNGSGICKQCTNTSCMERWIRRKIDAINYKGGKCFRCKLKLKDSHYSVFDFHHRDPATKKFDWTKLRLRPDEDIKCELDKCNVVCANCHRLIHAGL